MAVLGCLLGGTAHGGPEDAMKRLEEAASDPSFGKSYWLEMLNVVPEWERVILVFGYADDLSACTAILGLAKESNPSRNYRCMPNN